MELHRFTFHPSEPLQKEDSLSHIVERRFVQLFSQSNPLPFDIDKLSEGRHSLSLEENILQKISVVVGKEDTRITVQRTKRYGKARHVFVAHNGSVISGPGRRIYTMGNESGQMQNVGIARRTKTGLSLEYYLYASRS